MCIRDRTNDAPEAEPAQPPIPQAYQLSLFPTEDEQIAYIAEAGSYAPAAFSMSIPQLDIDHMLRREGNADYARMKIAKMCIRDSGYTDSNMLPLTKDRALELMEQDVSVYMLHTDNTEAMALSLIHI